MTHPVYKNALFSLVKDIHYVLNQTRIFSVHTHRPYRDKDGKQRFTNMGEGDQIAKDRLYKLIDDCGKMKEYANACVNGSGQNILNSHKNDIAVLHDLCNYRKHIEKKYAPQGNFKPEIGEPKVVVEFGAYEGHHAGVISTMENDFWDISDKAYACIVIDADVLDENGKVYIGLVNLAEDSLKIWADELKKIGIEIPQYLRPDPFDEASRFGQHGSLFVESFDDALLKASILTSEKRFNDAAVLYSYALTKCQNDLERARSYACLGLSYEDSKEFAMAHSCYMTALKYNPKMRGLNVNYGNTCRILGNREAAKICYQKELNIEGGDYISAHINLCQLYKENGEKDQAIEHVSAALKLDPNSLQAKNLNVELAGVE